jgi:hypothetical protein
MTLPIHRHNFAPVAFGLMRTKFPIPAETEGQKDIQAAWKEGRNYLGMLE